VKNKLPLEGVRIIDFTWLGAGPMTTRLLAEFGAEVIRIESKNRLDLCRVAGPFKDKIRGINRSGYFNNRNPEKKSISLNMKHPMALKIVTELVEVSDIVINNFTVGTLDKWGLGYEAVKKIKNAIIYVDMFLQGSSGPHKNYRGFGATMNALVGFNHLSGFPDALPYGSGTNYPDHVPNPTHAAFAIMAAIRHLRKTGEGQYIEFSQTETAINAIPIAIMDFANNGVNQSRNGNHHVSAAPHGVYETNDKLKWIAIAIMSDDEWSTFRKIIGEPDWAENKEFNTVQGRLANKEYIDQEIEKYTIKQDREVLFQKLRRGGVRVGIVYNNHEAIIDPQLNTRNQWAYIDHPETGYSLYDAMPIKMSKTPPRLEKPAPLLGEHTKEVMKNIVGMSDDAYSEYASSGLFD